jgi:hypothetical protein
MILEQSEHVVKERKIKRKRKATATVALETEPEGNWYRISFFNRRQMHDHSSVTFIYNAG